MLESLPSQPTGLAETPSRPSLPERLGAWIRPHRLALLGSAALMLGGPGCQPLDSSAQERSPSAPSGELVSSQTCNQPRYEHQRPWDARNSYGIYPFQKALQASWLQNPSSSSACKGLWQMQTCGCEAFHSAYFHSADYNGLPEMVFSATHPSERSELRNCYTFNDRNTSTLCMSGTFRIDSGGAEKFTIAQVFGHSDTLGFNDPLFRLASGCQSDSTCGPADRGRLWAVVRPDASTKPHDVQWTELPKIEEGRPTSFQICVVKNNFVKVRIGMTTGETLPMKLLNDDAAYHYFKGGVYIQRGHSSPASVSFPILEWPSASEECAY